MLLHRVTEVQVSNETRMILTTPGITSKKGKKRQRKRGGEADLVGRI